MGNVHARTLVKGWKVKTDDDRITLIRNTVFESIIDPLVIKTARLNVAHCPSRDERCEIGSIYYAIKDGPLLIPLDDGSVIQVPGLRFVEDVLNRDTYPTARVILEWMAQGANGEDCDGFGILMASLLMALGYQCGCIIVSLDGKTYVHIFPIVATPRSRPDKWEWLPLDATLPFMFPGWLPQRSFGVTGMKIYALIPGKVHGRMY